ncbi:pseudouridine synthase [Streptomyces lonarensis]|uniref:Pseudouridine synthase n=1 Tax=Streptomyces lonarensis TaxID=700599 RepID=A0A7X6D5J2_9ACTN|nr:pseudouridine synthase [Streptomyces lonarensis]NJQ08569.1 rRNA pseudouridine synthase [Streptomyces lonarensis]
MRSSGRNSNRNDRGAGSGRGRESAGRPRPEERRYPESGGKRQGGTGGGGGGRSGGGAGSGGAGGGKPGSRGGSPAAGGRSGAKRPVRSAPGRPRELDAKIEERNRERHSRDTPRTSKTFGEPDGVRLQKVLAQAGMGSRRACEELIDQRRVEVNGEIVTEQGLRVEPDRDEIRVDGLTVTTQKDLFFALNKPVGVVSAMEDPDGRPCLGDYVQNRESRLFHVGRLDAETEGLILLTNHGELAHRLTHPRYGVSKTYVAAIEVSQSSGRLPRDLGKQLKDGVQLEDGYARADSFRVVENVGRNYLVEITLHEGRKHIVRRMLDEVGFPVSKLVRTGFGSVTLGDQKSGWLRRMTNTEVGRLMREVDL